MKTAKSSSNRGEPAKESTPHPPATPPDSQEGEALVETEGPAEVKALEAGQENHMEKENAPPTKARKKMAQARDPDYNSSSSSSSSASDTTGDGSIASLLCHHRQERLRKKGKEAYMMEDSVMACT